LLIESKSNKCHLENNSPAQLVQRKEEAEELGGYFIVNGIEKLVRLLIVPRRNFPMGIIRNSWEKRAPGFTKFGVQIRSVRPDQTSVTTNLHAVDDGNVTFQFAYRKQLYLIPLVMLLKSLVDTNDREIFEGLVGPPGSKAIENTFLVDRVEILLRTYKSYNLYTKSQTRAFMGEKFRATFGIPQTMSNYEAGSEVLRKVLLPHLGNVNVTEAQDFDKFKMLLFMTRKLYDLVAGDCAPDNSDAISNQEILLGGFLYGQLLKERLEDWLQVQVRMVLNQWLRKKPENNFGSDQFRRILPVRLFSTTKENLATAMEYFLSTGNLISPSGLDLQQSSGFTIVAEKLNFLRYISHFRAVHRGSFFAQMKTTTVRKLLPESWGFLCPVHTPDGSPCGLLNHLAHKCMIVTHSVDVSAIPELVANLGVTDSGSRAPDGTIVVQLNGRILGWCTPKQAHAIHDTLRHWKVEGSHNVPRELEIGWIPISRGGAYPGIFMSSTRARMIRPVKYLALGKEDYVGSLEQVWMNIAAVEPEIISGTHTHVEIDPTNILSILANMTPFSDHNQSPRNMYQCQMGKQTMGTPGTAIRYRTDNKAYRLQTGQTPIARAPLHNDYGFDNFPNGMNAVVAVISYTSYDMDDAMIINKGAHERGFGHGTIYKTKKYDLAEDDKKGGTQSSSLRSIKKLFGFAPGGLVKGDWKALIDEDGLPFVGRRVQEGDVICAYHNVTYDSNGNFLNLDGRTQFMKYKDSEVAYIEEVRLLGNENGKEPAQAISVKYRIPRGPYIGDKFSSRHGQKGVLSYKWPSVDMPFSESGIVPDVIINPHAFPSRMTIGMFVESIAAKAGALHGLAQDSTPFKFDEDHMAVDYFGDQLKKAGFNYHGNEPMYSGITGEELYADIFVGVVYYQRLRHMVNDKYQVRTTGPIAQLTGQPVKGRAKGGGIRVGEMERDALLAHGAAHLLQDRLLNCSDYQRSWICKECGSFLSIQPTVSDLVQTRKGTGVVRCRRCAHAYEGGEGMVWEDGQGGKWVGGGNTTIVAVPGVLKFLDVELSAMGVRMKYNIGP
jgi:DNA-directed RNA polymerase I subunit RPA2